MLNKISRLLNDQLDENDVHDDNRQPEVENELNLNNEDNNEDIVEEIERPEDEIERPQEAVIEPENVEIEANDDEVPMQPVNVEQPDDNQNDLFNEVKTK